MQTELDLFLHSARPALTTILGASVAVTHSISGPLPDEYVAFIEETMTHMINGLQMGGLDRQRTLPAIRRATADAQRAASMMRVGLLFQPRAEAYFTTALADNPVLLAEVLRRFRNIAAAVNAQVAATRMDHTITRLGGSPTASLQAMAKRYVR